MDEPSPVPASTVTVAPSAVSFFAVSGVRAQRVSPSRRSRVTAMATAKRIPPSDPDGGTLGASGRLRKAPPSGGQAQWAAGFGFFRKKKTGAKITPKAEDP